MFDWLVTVDNGNGVLLQYWDKIRDDFGCDFCQIKAAKNTTVLRSVNDIDPLFWEALGVTMHGHKLLFAQAMRFL